LKGIEGESMMASKTKKRKRVRAWKNKPNKVNLKADMRRIQRNREILKELASEDEGR